MRLNFGWMSRELDAHEDSGAASQIRFSPDGVLPVSLGLIRYLR
jgi:hypothetical protein